MFQASSQEQPDLMKTTVNLPMDPTERRQTLLTASQSLPCQHKGQISKFLTCTTHDFYLKYPILNLTFKSYG